jgi:hypothetical protein
LHVDRVLRIGRVGVREQLGADLEEVARVHAASSASSGRIVAKVALPSDDCGSAPFTTDSTRKRVLPVASTAAIDAARSASMRAGSSGLFAPYQNTLTQPRRDRGENGKVVSAALRR